MTRFLFVTLMIFASNSHAAEAIHAFDYIDGQLEKLAKPEPVYKLETFSGRYEVVSSAIQAARRDFGFCNLYQQINVIGDVLKHPNTTSFEHVTYINIIEELQGMRRKMNERPSCRPYQSEFFR